MKDLVKDTMTKAIKNDENFANFMELATIAVQIENYNKVHSNTLTNIALDEMEYLSNRTMRYSVMDKFADENGWCCAHLDIVFNDCIDEIYDSLF